MGSRDATVGTRSAELSVALEPVLDTFLTLQVTDPTGRELPATVRWVGTSTPGCEPVRVDVPTIQLGAGRHELEVSAPGHVPVVFDLVVGRGAASLDVVLEPGVLRSVRLDEVPIVLATDAVVPLGDSQDEIERLAWAMADEPGRVEIVGFADERGERVYNAEFSRRRAEAVADALRVRGIAPERLRVRVGGERDPELTDSQPTAWAHNRRVEVWLRAVPVVQRAVLSAR